MGVKAPSASPRVLRKQGERRVRCFVRPRLSRVFLFIKFPVVSYKTGMVSGSCRHFSIRRNRGVGSAGLSAGMSAPATAGLLWHSFTPQSSCPPPTAPFTPVPRSTLLQEEFCALPLLRTSSHRAPHAAPHAPIQAPTALQPGLCCTPLQGSRRSKPSVCTLHPDTCCRQVSIFPLPPSCAGF